MCGAVAEVGRDKGGIDQSSVFLAHIRAFLFRGLAKIGQKYKVGVRLKVRVCVRIKINLN